MQWWLQIGGQPDRESVENPAKNQLDAERPTRSVTRVEDIGRVRRPASLCRIAIGQRTVSKVADVRGADRDGERTRSEAEIR